MSIDRDLTSELLRLVRELADQLRPGNDFAQALGIDHSLERDYGLDSLSRAELLTRIESELGVSLEPAALSQAETPHDLLRAIVACAGLAFVPIHARAHARRLPHRISARNA